ncbi:hypothetical protein PhCBS80983_g04029 [Powellomyces hirtus]|uniref:TOG domain-containing protein n=1 Tax=Powellomyces hirtus TaxID=109895 RepID=A0A507E1U9_9FUNG|nr:hypothetical protein PhCBS80983_g04029 [Powellomyces hirtus]
MAAPEEDFTSLPLPDRLVHKSWKARQGAYDELATLFATLDPDDDNAYRKWQDYLKKMVSEANAVAQESGLAAVLAWVANAPSASKTRGVIASMVVDKCMGSTRAGTRQKALDILLMYMEIDVADPVIEEIIPGLNHKTPKNVIACVNALREALHQFGSGVVNVRPLLKQLSKIFDHKDKNVRAEGTNLAIELYRWLGSAMNNSLNDLKPVQIKELQDQFDALPQEKAVPERLLRSEQAKIQSQGPVEDGGAAEDTGEPSGVEEPDPVDPYTLVDPVNILDKLPKNFYEELGSKKWQERKEALITLLGIAQQPRLEDGRYGELVSVLGKKMADVNVVVMTLAANCVQAIATGLRSGFAQYRGMVIHPLLEKFKEKKQHVVDALRGAVDAVYASVSMSEVVEDIVTYSTHKNPQVRSETLQWAVRCLKTTRKLPPKPEIKTLSEAFVKSLEDGDNVVRESAAEALGTLMKVVSERVLTVYLDKLDNIKTAKVKEYCDKAEVKLVGGGSAAKASAAPGRRATVAAPVKTLRPSNSSEIHNKENAPPPPAARSKTVSRAPTKSAPSSAAGLKKKPASSAGAAKAAAPVAKVASKGDAPISYKFSDDSAAEWLEEFAGADVMKQLTESLWKTRLAAVQAILEKVQQEPKEGIECEALTRALSSKPGWKESNFQVMATMINVFQYIAKEVPQYNTTAAILVIPGLADKLGDMKVKKSAGDCLTTISEKLSFQFVLAQAYDTISKQKAPKVLADSLMWIQMTLLEFGTAGLQVRDLIEFLKGVLGNTNAAVRTNAVTVLGTIRMFMGPDVRRFVEDLNPQLLALIDTEFEKAAAKAPPPIIKQAPEGTTAELEDLFPRVDILTELKGETIDMLGDASWKLRKEALDEIARVIEASNKRLQPNLGNELVPALKARLNDSNKNLAMNAVELIGNLAIAVGKPFERHAKTLVGPMAGLLVDQKAHVRGAALAALENVHSAVGLDSMTPSCATALMAEQPQLRKDLLKWLGEKMEATDKLPDLHPMVHPILACLQDKTADVRKGAQTVLVFVVDQVGLDVVRDKCSDLFKGASLASVQPFLDALRPTGARGAAVAASSTAKPATPAKLRRVATAPAGASNSSRAGAPARKSGLSRPSSGSAPAKREVETPQEASAPLVSSDMRAKDQRAAADKGMHKWTFDVPRPELLEFLADQCQGIVSPQVHGQLFSTDHYKEKGFLAGLTAIDEPISNMPASITAIASSVDLDEAELKARYIACTDLILKYVTLRFFDTNTSMFLKCLELLEHLFTLLDGEGYHMSEYEAASFLPFFINKTGDPKETMRVKIRSILKQLTRVYPASKLFTYLLRGLESKNARTRTECLEELASLVQRNSMNVCVPNKAFPLIASQLADRDAAVRNGALAAISQAYLLIGDTVYSYLGRISEKDKSLVQERLKRMPAASKIGVPSAASKMGAERTSPNSRQSARSSMPSSRASGGNSPRDTKPANARMGMTGQNGKPSPTQVQVESEQPEPTIVLSAPRAKVPVFSIDYEEFERATAPPKPSSPSRLQTMSAHNSPAPPSRADYTGLGRIDDAGVPASAPPTRAEFLERLARPAPSLVSQGPYKADILITRITDPDRHIATDALRQLARLLQNDPEAVAPYLDECVPTMLLQFRETVVKLPTGDNITHKYAKHLLVSMLGIFSSSPTASCVAKHHVLQLLDEVVGVIHDPSLKKPADDPHGEVMELILRHLNSLVLRVLEKCNRNLIFDVCLRLLMSTTNALADTNMASRELHLRRQDSFKRCMWKLIKSIPGPVNISVLFRDLQVLMMEYSPQHWQALMRQTGMREEVNLPVLAVKNIIMKATTALGDDVFQHLDLIEEYQEYGWVRQYINSCHQKNQEKRLAGDVPSGSATPSAGSMLDLSAPSQQQQQQAPCRTDTASGGPASPMMSRSRAPMRSSRLALQTDTRESSAGNSIDNLSTANGAATALMTNVAAVAATTTDAQSYLWSERWPAERILREHPLHARVPLDQLEREVKDLFDRVRANQDKEGALKDMYKLREKYPYVNEQIENELSRSASFFARWMRKIFVDKDKQAAGHVEVSPTALKHEAFLKSMRDWRSDAKTFADDSPTLSRRAFLPRGAFGLDAAAAAPTLPPYVGLQHLARPNVSALVNNGDQTQQQPQAYIPPSVTRYQSYTATTSATATTSRPGSHASSGSDKQNSNNSNNNINNGDRSPTSSSSGGKRTPPAIAMDANGAPKSPGKNAALADIKEYLKQRKERVAAAEVQDN